MFDCEEKSGGAVGVGVGGMRSERVQIHLFLDTSVKSGTGSVHGCGPRTARD